MTAQYELRLLDHTDNIVARFAGLGRGAHGGGLQSFSYRKRLRTPGQMTVRIFGNDDRIKDHLLLPNALDYKWQVWRKDPVAGLDWHKDFEALHRAEELTFGETGRQVYTSYGTGLNCLLYSEPIRWPAGSAEAEKSGDCATLAEEFVRENIGDLAGLDDLGGSRVRPGLYVAGHALSGTAWQGSRANKLLADVLTELAEIAAADYNILGTPSGYAFTWRNNRWGVDRTPNGVLFSARKGTSTNISFGVSYLDEVTTCYALGQGQNQFRKVVTWSSPGLAYSPVARRAVSRNANQEYDDTALSLIAEARVRETQAHLSASFSVLQTVGTRYGRDYDYGDLVRVQDQYARSLDVKILGVTVSVGGDGTENISLETERE